MSLFIKSYLTVIAFAACETNGFVLQPGLTCNDPETWPEVSLRVRIWKRHADIVYAILGTPRITQLTTVSEKLNSTYVPALSYLTFYDAILPNGMPDLKTNYLYFLLAFSGSAYYRNVDLLPTLATLPWRVQLGRDFQGLNVSDENMIKAMTCVTVERIKLALNSLWVFVVVSGSILLWCFVRLIQSAVIKKPPLAPFADLDLAIKLVRSGDVGGKVLFDGLTELSAGAVTEHLSDVRLQITGQGNEIEMQPLPKRIMRRIKGIGEHLRPKRRAPGRSATIRPT